MYKLELVNKKTKEVTIFDDIVDINYGEKLFFNFEINATQLADGEYTLSLYEDGKLIVTDTLCVGDFDVVGLQYKKGEAIYIETKLETKTQDKSVELSDIATTIIPDEDYDAMTTVEVNAQPVYDGAYNAGHTEGYESGIRAQKEKLESIEITANGVYSKEDGYNNIVVEVPDVNGSYDAGYSDGIEQGIEQGIVQGKEYQKEQLTNIEITSNGTYEREDGYKNVVVNVEGKIEGNYIVLDTTGVTNMDNYFTGKPITSYNFDFGGVTNTNYMFRGALFDSVNEVNLPDATTAKYMYTECSQLTKAPKIIGPKLEDASAMFYKCTSLTSSPEVNLPLATNISYMFEDTQLINFPTINAPEAKNASGMFRNCKFPVDFPTINAPKLENASSMFASCEGITSVPDLYFPELTNAEYMFGLCTGVTSFGTLSFPKVTNTVNMFSNSRVASIPYFDTSNVTNMKEMFQYCMYLTSVAEYNTSNVTDMSKMFYYCSKLETVPQFNTSKVTTMKQMFQRCQVLTSLPHFDTSKVTDMTQMLEYSTVTTIPQFDTSKVTTVYRMFYGTDKLVSLPLLDFGNITNINMFLGVGQNSLTDLGGFKDLKIDWKDNYGLASCPNLTYQSIMNVINNLYDFRANGDSSTTKTLKMHKNTMALLTDDDKAIATAKGWVLTS